MNFPRFSLHAAALAVAAFAAPAAQAHVVLEYQVAQAGRSYKATFKVGHGCGESATRQIVVAIPEGVRGAKPMPKPGWTLEIVRAPLAQPYNDHGRMVTEDVARITWTARTEADALPDAQYDEFVLNAGLPGRAGPMYWPVQQVCVQGRTDWVEVPAAGQPRSALRYPAALLELLAPDGAAGHAH